MPVNYWFQFVYKDCGLQSSKCIKSYILLYVSNLLGAAANVILKGLKNKQKNTKKTKSTKKIWKSIHNNAEILCIEVSRYDTGSHSNSLASPCCTHVIKN